MTAFRSCVLLAAFAVLGLAVVYLRAEQTRALARAAALESQWVESRRELWRLQTGVARLRTPARLYTSLDLFGAELAKRSNHTDGPAVRVTHSLGDVPVD